MWHASHAFVEHKLQRHDIALSGANFGYLSEYTFLPFGMSRGNMMAELNRSVFMPVL